MKKYLLNYFTMMEYNVFIWNFSEIFILALKKFVTARFKKTIIKNIYLTFFIQENVLFQNFYWFKKIFFENKKFIS